MRNDRHRHPEPPDIGNEERAGRAPAHRAAGRGSNWKLLSASAVLLCAIAAGTSLAAFGSPAGQRPAQDQAAALQTAQPTPPVASSSVTPGSANVTSNGIAKTAMQWPTALGNQVRQWTAGPGGAALSAVTAQVGKASQAGGLKSYAQMKAACADLGSSVKTAQGAPPIPYDAMQRLYASALTGLAVAVADCRTAISVRSGDDENLIVHVNSALLNRSATELAAGTKELYTATAEIRTLRR